MNYVDLNKVMKAYKFYDDKLEFYNLTYIIYHYNISSAVIGFENILSRRGKVYDYHEVEPNTFKITLEDENVWYVIEFDIVPGTIMIM